jgi:diacylglycerol kinase family enzyme
MRVVRGRELRVATEREAPWQVDGEVGGETPVHCGVERGALRLICGAPGGRWHGGVAEA